MLRHLEKLVLLSRSSVAEPDPEPLRSSPKKRWITRGIRCGNDEKPLRLERKSAESPPEAFLDSVRERQMLREREAARQ